MKPDEKLYCWKQGESDPEVIDNLQINLFNQLFILHMIDFGLMAVAEYAYSVDMHAHYATIMNFVSFLLYQYIILKCYLQENEFTNLLIDNKCYSSNMKQVRDWLTIEYYSFYVHIASLIAVLIRSKVKGNAFKRAELKTITLSLKEAIDDVIFYR